MAEFGSLAPDYTEIDPLSGMPVTPSPEAQGVFRRGVGFLKNLVNIPDAGKLFGMDADTFRTAARAAMTVATDPVGSDVREAVSPVGKKIGSIVPHIAEGMADQVTMPGRAFGSFGSPPTDEEMREWGPGMALTMVGGARLPGGAAGSGMSRLVQPEAKTFGSLAPADELWHGISKIKLPKPVSEMSATHVPVKGVVEKEITPSDLQGGLLLPAIGDRSIANTNLTGFNGYKFETPVEMQGGHGFMAANADRGVAWASGAPVISRIANAARGLAEKGKPVYFPYTAMGERSVDFSHHISDSLAEALRQTPLPRSAQREFNAAMKSEDANFGAVKDWPGVGSEGLRDYLVSAKGDVRNKFAKLMDRSQFQSQGFPSVAEARFAATDPRLLDAPTGAAGLSIARLDPSGKVVKDVSGHRTYDTDLGGDYLGGLGRSIPKEVFYPDLISAYRKLGYEPYRYDYLMGRGVTGAPVAQRANQQWVDRVSNWMEKNPKEAMLYSGSNDLRGSAATGAIVAGGEQAPLSMAPGGIRAYHGSPYDFDRFDLGKVGTGEGAQAYGHGLYFAENEGVARNYRENLAMKGQTMPQSFAANRLKAAGGDRDAAIASLSRELEGLPEGGFLHGQHAAAIDILRSGAELIPRGKMYEVNINAKPEQFLDWDRPLAQQPPAAQSIAREAGMHPDEFDITKGGALYRKAGDLFGPRGGGSNFNAAAAEGLREAGIPGIRYLDQGSRGPATQVAKPDAAALKKYEGEWESLVQDRRAAAGERGTGDTSAVDAKLDALHEKMVSETIARDPNAGRTSNYVVFDPGLIKILRKYGLAGLTAGGAAAGSSGTFGSLAPAEQ